MVLRTLRVDEDFVMTGTTLLTYEPAAFQPAPQTSASAPHTIALAEPHLRSGLALMTALSFRHSVREFTGEALSDRQLGELLWAADGINRRVSGGRTAPSPHGIQEIDIYAALAAGVYRYEPQLHRLVLKRAVDARSQTGYQDFVANAALDLIYVVNYGRLVDMPTQQRDVFSAVTAGAIAQNVYLYCASAGLATVVRGWLNRRNLAEAIGLNEDEVPILAQTVGVPAPQRT
jgi:SagB-type dehydrogenase family enzyme